MSDFIDDYEDDNVEFNVRRPKQMTIEIPEFLRNKETPSLDEESQAVLNNVPGNTEIEEMNHLNELKQVCKNWKEEEWKRVLLSAPSKLMTDELERRLSGYEDYVRNQRGNMKVLTNIDL